MNSLARRRRGLDIWPGFVDALTSLILVMIFVLLLFAIGQFVLSQTLAGKNQALADLNAQIAQLAQTLSLAQDAKVKADSKVNELSASLGSMTSERDAAKAEPRRSRPTSPRSANSRRSSNSRSRRCPRNSTSRKRTSSPRPTSTRNPPRRSSCSTASSLPCRIS